MAKKKAEMNYPALLQNEFERWEHLYKKGGSDPFGTDGENLYLVRNHILYYKSKIEETVQNGNYPEVYFRETPPEIDRNYMARKDEIRENAIKTLAIFKKDKNLQFIKRTMASVDEKFLRENGIQNIVNYENTLKKAIAENKLVEMRRYEKADTYLSSFESGAERLKQYVPPEYLQISLFDLDLF